MGLGRAPGPPGPSRPRLEKGLQQGRWRGSGWRRGPCCLCRGVPLGPSRWRHAWSCCPSRGRSQKAPPQLTVPPRPQICFLTAVNVIGQRMNFMVILHGCWLVAILTRRRRPAIARLWPNYCLFLALFLLYQYLLCLGMPPALCIGEHRQGSRPLAGLPMPNACFLPSLLF